MYQCYYVPSLFNTFLVVTGLSFHCKTPDSFSLPIFSTHSSPFAFLLTAFQKNFWKQIRATNSLERHGVVSSKGSSTSVKIITQGSIKMLCWKEVVSDVKITDVLQGWQVWSDAPVKAVSYIFTKYLISFENPLIFEV